MMSNLSNDVGRQRIRVEQITKEFNAIAEEHAGTAKFKKATGSVLAELHNLTVRLAERIADVETELRERASEVDQRLGEYEADPLLGLPTRAFFEASLAERIDDYRNRKTQFSMAILDMDLLGRANAQYGTAAGDRLLRAAVDAVKQTVGRNAVVARMGDDEIGVLFLNCDSHSAADKLDAARILAAQSTIAVPGGILRPEYSFGVAEYAGRRKAASLIARCDEALVAAKEAGRGQGYLHDGDACVPIRHPENDPSVSNESEGGLDSCFAEIRARLKEVTAGE
jgi:diguanylate cyclase (GGDEF)-like protein